MSEPSGLGKPETPAGNIADDVANMPPADTSEVQEIDPGAKSVFNFLLYGLSIPERALRSSLAMAGGMVRETTDLLIPQAFRNSRTYRSCIVQVLDFWVEDIGGVERPKDKASMTDVENYVARKVVSNVIELASLATIHLSPLTVLAIVSDIAYGSKTYLHELSGELKKQGVIDEQSTIDSATDLLNAVSNASGQTSQAFDVPPLSVKGLRETIKQTEQAVRTVNPQKLIPQKEIERLWNEIHVTATRENMSMFAVGGAMTMYTINKIGKLGRGALSTVRVAGNMFDEHVLDYYTDSLKDIAAKGIFASFANSSRPYIGAVYRNFSGKRGTLTQTLFSGHLFVRIGKAFCGLFRRKKQENPKTE